MRYSRVVRPDRIPAFIRTTPARRVFARATLALAASSLALLAVASCGGSSRTPTDSGGGTPAPTPTPTPVPSPTPSQSAACRLSEPTVDCSTRKVAPLEMADVLQSAIDVAIGTPGTMYAEYANRIYDLDLFRSRTIEHLTAAGLCGAWDFGNERGDEIFVRSADGCVVEQYDLVTGEGGVRVPNKASNAFQEGFGVPVPGPKPQFPKEGDLQCSLPGDRSTFCFGIKGTQGEFGAEVYRLLVQVMNENPAPLRPERLCPRPGRLHPRPAPGRRLGHPEPGAPTSRRSRRSSARTAICATVTNGDILKVKKVTKGNVFHEEMDVVQNPASGGSTSASW